MTDEYRPPRAAIVRTLAALAAASVIALGVYLLLEATRPDNGLVSFTFLLLLPAAICGLASYLADPWKDRRHRFYLMMPVWILLIVAALGLVFLQEGVICIILLAPLWLISGLIGAEVTYRLRRRQVGGRSHCVTMLALPLIAMQVEPLIALPEDEATVTRTIEIGATPDTLWPLVRGVPDVRHEEGAWNITQSLIGVPRPVSATLSGNGRGADRYARWEHNIRFRERVTDWELGRRIGWRFIFDDVEAWGYTDRHLMPDSPYFRIATGGYRLEPLTDGRTRVTLHTRYTVRTPVNFYSRLWGELFLGDVQNNILAIIKQRAERQAATTRKV